MSKSLLIFVVMASSLWSDIGHLNKQSPMGGRVSPPFLQEVIVLDPGHGGKDPGTRSLTKPPYLEKRLTLTCSEYIRHALQSLGYHPLLTRKSDHSLTLEDRVEFSKASGCNLFISIHFNSAPNTDAKGIEVFYFDAKKDPQRTKASKELAQLVLKRALEYTGANNRKVKAGNFHVIRETDVPAILIEGGFLTNDDEFRQLKNPHYLKRLGLGIARGVDDYLVKRRKRGRPL